MKYPIRQVVSHEKLTTSDLNTIIDALLIRASTNKYNVRLEELPKYNNNINDKEQSIIAKLRGMMRK
jgi:hypothetical protein